MIYDPLSWIHHRFVLACIMLLYVSVYLLILLVYIIYHFRIFLDLNNDQFCERCFGMGASSRQNTVLAQRRTIKTRVGEIHAPGIVFWI